MTDLTAGKAKCLLPVGGLPLLWSVASFFQWSQDDICRTWMTLSFRYPLHMLQCNGFTDVIVIVQVKNDDCLSTFVGTLHEYLFLNMLQDSAKAEVTRIPEKHGLSIKLEVLSSPVFS